MSEPRAGADAPEISLGLLAWRDTLANASPVPSGVDLADWAGLLVATGHGAMAGSLEDVAALHAGFSPQACAERAEGGTAHPFGRTAPTAGDDVATRAATELRQLGEAIGQVGFGGENLARASQADPDVASPGLDCARTARLLRSLLERPQADREEELASMLRTVASAAGRLAGLDYRAYARAPLSILVPAITAAGLIDFILQTRDLWSGPTGSPTLMHRAARFDAGGLGPYFCNVGRLARGSRDVIALAQIAHSAAVETDRRPASGDVALAPWIALLSRGCRAGVLRELVDELGDAGAENTLLAILERVSTFSTATTGVDTVARIRDAALDNADFPLAARAQQVIARIRPDSALEGMILGTIEASGGRRELAAAIFRGWLARSPNDDGIGERLRALEEGRFEPFIFDRGFGSPADRQATRLRRRGILPVLPRVRGNRIEAAQVR